MPAPQVTPKSLFGAHPFLKVCCNPNQITIAHKKPWNIELLYSVGDLDHFASIERDELWLFTKDGAFIMRYPDPFDPLMPSTWLSRLFFTAPTFVERLECLGQGLKDVYWVVKHSPDGGSLTLYYPPEGISTMPQWLTMVENQRDAAHKTTSALPDLPATPSWPP